MIYDLDNGKQLRLRAEAVSVIDHLDDACIERIRHDLARKLSQEILHCDKFFEAETLHQRLVRYKLDVFVMTADELTALLENAFMKGLSTGGVVK